MMLCSHCAWSQKTCAIGEVAKWIVERGCANRERKMNRCSTWVCTNTSKMNMGMEMRSKSCAAQQWRSDIFLYRKRIYIEMTILLFSHFSWRWFILNYQPPPLPPLPRNPREPKLQACPYTSTFDKNPPCVSRICSELTFFFVSLCFLLETSTNRP